MILEMIVNKQKIIQWLDEYNSAVESDVHDRYKIYVW